MANEHGSIPDDRPTLPSPAPRPRGFAAMPRAQVSAIARIGGRAAHVAGTAHQWDHEEASLAGKKGGRITAERKAAAKAQQHLRDADEHNRASGE